MERNTLPIKKIAIFIFVIVALFIVAAFVGGLIEVDREQVNSETTLVNQPVCISAMTFAELDRVIQSEYPQYCDGMIFTDATAEIEFRGDSMLQGEASLVYYRYIDESMEGGNVEMYACRFDLMTNTLASVEHEYGSGKSISVSAHALSENIIKAPLDQYVFHATELTDLQSDRDYLFAVDCTESWMKLALRSIEDNEVYYRETLTQWPENEDFNERTFELIND